jgi:DNA-binding XRE family transcriptional regulator
MIKYDSVRKKLMSDPEVVKAYEEHKAEFEVAKALIQARIDAKMTQTEVAQKMHTSQAAIARLESGYHFPSLQTILKYARAVNHSISFEIHP